MYKKIVSVTNATKIKIMFVIIEVMVRISSIKDPIVMYSIFWKSLRYFFLTQRYIPVLAVLITIMSKNMFEDDVYTIVIELKRQHKYSEPFSNR